MLILFDISMNIFKRMREIPTGLQYLKFVHSQTVINHLKKVFPTYHLIFLKALDMIIFHIKFPLFSNVVWGPFI